MTRYQIIERPIATATGEKGTWSFVAHGARYERAQAIECIENGKKYGYERRKIKI